MTTRTRRDARGNPVSTGSAAALDASERALWRMMSFYGTPLDDLDAAIAADPAWLLPGLMKAGFLLSLTEPSLVAEATALLEAAAASRDRGNARERAHLAALQRLAAGDWAGAGAAWGEILQGHPRDALALQWAHLLAFYRGDAKGLREQAEAALPSWRDDDALHPYVLALHAFGLEEEGRYAEAEATGRRALAGAARVPWAIHAVAHVMEMQGRHEEGARWMNEWRGHWGAAEGDGSGNAPNGFAGHLGWHEALFALEGVDTGTALRVFDRYLDAGRVEIALQRVDAASLLWRLHLLGADVGDRWQALVAGWPLDAANAGRSVFNDAHATMALIGAGESARARAWVALCIDGAERGAGWNHAVSRELGAPLLRGLLAFGEGRAGDAAAAIAPLRDRLARIGGSHAQRDVIEQTLIAAAALGTDRLAGRALHEARTRAKAATPLSAWWSRRLR
ncbi:MAG TPA: tetratricopeptide repeat protein [Caldimonas sp.]|nr:tetratricopeptide repeat protein [Caldimonas sp.]